MLYNLNITDILYTYILEKSSSLKKLKLGNGDFRICVELPIKAKFSNLNMFAYSNERERIGGKKSNAIKDDYLYLLKLLSIFLKIKIIDLLMKKALIFGVTGQDGFTSRTTNKKLYRSWCQKKAFIN